MNNFFSCFYEVEHVFVIWDNNQINQKNFKQIKRQKQCTVSFKQRTILVPKSFLLGIFIAILLAVRSSRKKPGDEVGSCNHERAKTEQVLFTSQFMTRGGRHRIEQGALM